MKTIYRKSFLGFCVLLIGGGLYCAPLAPSETPWSDDPADATDPTGQTMPLQQESPFMIDKALTAVRLEINQARPAGITQMLTALQADLSAKGIDTKCLAKITDSYIGSDMPAPSSSATSLPDGLGTAKKGLNYTKYYDCPLNAPELTGNTPCDKLVESVVASVKTQIDSNKAKVEALIASQYKDLSTKAQQFIAAWSTAAKAYGADVAAIYAINELKAAAQCDTKANGLQVAYHLGYKQGWDTVVGMKAWAMSQVTTCITNTDAIAEAVRVKAKAGVDAYMKQNIICEKEDISNTNPAFQAAEVKRKSGMKTGIDSRVEILKNELFQFRATVPCPNTGGGGEPIVIDLDGDGLKLTAKRVPFDLLNDGTRPACTWVGPREGLLAIDHNGDGVINSVAELMGNASTCGDHTCYDGVEAMQALDINKDGVLDSKDAAFSAFRIWRDRNHDGVSQAAELTTLADHGIRAFRLQAKQILEHTAGGTLTARFSVVTDNGLRDAYDVWFKVKLSVENLPALAPR